MIEQVDLPDMASGQWRVEKYTTDSFGCLAYAVHGRGMPAGKTYTRLMRGGTVVMSDTPAEMRDHYYAVHKATGSCLLNGLGIGMVLKAILSKQDVTDVTVVELSEEVLQMVAPHYSDPRVTFVHASAFTYQPPKWKRYQMVWHDIWDNICADNLPEMHRLHRRYGRRSDWQGSWARGECERAEREWKRQQRWYE